MFHFFTKHKKPLFEGLCDIHNHLLPAIDDGSKNVAMSLQMLKGFKALGFTSVCQLLMCTKSYTQIRPLP